MDIQSLWNTGLIQSEGLDRLAERLSETELQDLACRVCNRFGLLGFFTVHKLYSTTKIFAFCKNQKERLKKDFGDLVSTGSIAVPLSVALSRKFTTQEEARKRIQMCIKFQFLPWIETAKMPSSSALATMRQELHQKQQNRITRLFSLLNPKTSISCEASELASIKAFLISRSCLFEYSRSNDKDLFSHYSWEAIMRLWVQKAQLSATGPTLARANELLGSLHKVRCLEKKQTGTHTFAPQAASSGTETSFKDYLYNLSISFIFKSYLDIETVDASVTKAEIKLFEQDDMYRQQVVFYTAHLAQIAKKDLNIPTFLSTVDKDLQYLRNLITDKKFTTLYASAELLYLFKKQAINTWPKGWHPLTLVYHASPEARALLKNAHVHLDNVMKTIGMLQNLEKEHSFSIPINEQLSCVMAWQANPEAHLQKFTNYTQVAQKLFKKEQQRPLERLKFCWTPKQSIDDRFMQLLVADASTIPHLTETDYFLAIKKLRQHPSLLDLVGTLQQEHNFTLHFSDHLLIFACCAEVLTTPPDFTTLTATLLQGIKKYPIPAAHQMLLLLELLAEDSKASVKISDHLAFLNQIEKFVNHDLPWQLVCSCLLFHDITKSDIDLFVKKFEDIKAKNPFTKADLEQLYELRTDFSAPVDMPKLIPGTDVDYRQGLCDFAQRAIHNASVSAEGLGSHLVFCPASLPFPVDKQASHFSSAGEIYFSHTLASVYSWEKTAQNSYIYRLSMLKSPLTAATVTCTIEFPFSEAEIQQMVYQDSAAGFSFVTSMLMHCTKDEFILPEEASQPPSSPHKKYDSLFSVALSRLKTTMSQTRHTVALWEQFQHTAYKYRTLEFTEVLRSTITENLHRFSAGRMPAAACTDETQQAALGNIYPTDQAHVLSLLPPELLQTSTHPNCFTVDTNSCFDETVTLSILVDNQESKTAARVSLINTKETVCCKITIEAYTIDYTIHYPAANFCGELQTRLIGWQLLMAKSRLYEKLIVQSGKSLPVQRMTEEKPLESAVANITLSDS